MYSVLPRGFIPVAVQMVNEQRYTTLDTLLWLVVKRKGRKKSCEVLGPD